MQDIIDRGMEIVNERPDITGDELKKTAEAVNKAVQTMNLIQGKATSRNGTEQPSETDKAIENLSKAFQAAEQKVTGLGAPEGI